MSSSDNAQKPSKVLGERISTIRIRKGMSRANVVDEVHKNLPVESSLRKSITESSLREIEEGNRVNVTRGVLEAIIEGMHCDVKDRFDIITSADRNVLADSKGEVDDAAKVLLLGIETMYRADFIVRTQINILLRDRRISTLDEDELFEIFETIIVQASARRKPKKTHPSNTRPPTPII